MPPYASYRWASHANGAKPKSPVSKPNLAAFTVTFLVLDLRVNNGTTRLGNHVGLLKLRLEPGFQMVLNGHMLHVWLMLSPSNPYHCHNRDWLHRLHIINATECSYMHL